MDTFLWIYFTVGVLTLLFAMTNYEFLEGTAWWQKILAWIMAVLLWPVFLVIIAVEGP